MTDGDIDLEWEEWRAEDISFIHHMVAGSLAGLAEHVTMFPIDTLKTHLQCERCINGSKPTQTFQCAANLIREKGVLRLWRGVGATFSGCVPAHAAYFSIYENMKIWTGASKSGHHPAQAAICGASAAIGHDMFMTPFDTIKQRMQLGHYRGMIDCIHSIFVKEGMRAFYMSLPTTLVMNIPYGSIMMPINESARKLLNPTGAYRLDISMLSGGIAGATAALLTTPLDVIKTRLQTQDLQPCPALANSSKIFNSIGSAANVSGILGAATPAVREGLKYASMADVFNRILAEEGFRGFFRGALLRMLVHAPSVAISWTAYDTAKKILSQVT